MLKKRLSNGELINTLAKNKCLIQNYIKQYNIYIYYYYIFFHMLLFFLCLHMFIPFNNIVKILGIHKLLTLIDFRNKSYRCLSKIK